jgi:hypothetical protein
MCALFGRNKEPKTLNCPLCGETVLDDHELKSEHVATHLIPVTDNQGRPAFTFKCDRCGMADLAWTKRSAAHAGVAVHGMERHSTGMDWQTSAPFEHPLDAHTAIPDQYASGGQVDLDRAREVLKSMCSAVARSNDAMEAAIAQMRRECGLPHADDAHATMRAFEEDPKVFSRPWRWMEDTAKKASAEEQHDIVAMAFAWSGRWYQMVQPNLNGNDLFLLGLDQMPEETVTITRDLALKSVPQMNPDEVLVVTGAEDLTPRLIGKGLGVEF